MKTVYALLVGINDYPSPIPALSGCVSDVERIKTHLEQSDQLQLESLFLTDQNATKAAIVEGFESHLAKAKEEDIILFYYSGHGAQEEADEVFWDAEANRKLQGLVCYDSFVHPDQEEYHFLSDKELRYLIHQLSNTGAHILSIFDCCHSGDNTRSSETSVRKRQISIDTKDLDRAFPKRKWEDFIFAKALKREDFEGKALSEILPVGRHVQLAACLPSQSAYESNGQGIFTNQLLQLLQETNNDISYQELKSKLPLRIPKKFRQTPLVDAPHQLNSLFLGFEQSQAPEEFAYVTFANGAWWMDVGLLHGLSPNVKQLKVSTANGQEQYTAQIVQVYDDKTKISFAEAPKAQEGLKVFFSDLPREEVRVMIKDHAHHTKLQKALKEQIEESLDLAITEEQEQADLIIHIGQEKIKLTFNYDEHYYLVPLVNVDDDADKNILPYVFHIANWIRIKNLENPRPSRIKKGDIEVEFIKVGKWDAEENMEAKDNTYHTAYDKNADGEYSGKVKIKITNHSAFKVYISMLYLNMNFMIYEKVLRPELIELEPQGIAYSFEGQPIDLTFEQEVKAFKLSHSTTYFKLLASTKPFQVDKLAQNPLPKPTQTQTRVLVRRKPNSSKTWSNWRADLYTLKIQNPYL